MAGIKIPRASITVTFLRDPDVLVLMKTGPEGLISLWAFVGLLIEAKSQRNGGVFRGDIGIYAPSLGMTPEMLTGAIERMAQACRSNGNKPWIVVGPRETRIRNWEKWNQTGWGGHRPNSGPKGGSSGVQDEPNLNTKNGSRGSTPAPAPVLAPVLGISSTSREAPTSSVRGTVQVVPKPEFIPDSPGEIWDIAERLLKRPLAGHRGEMVRLTQWIDQEAAQPAPVIGGAPVPTLAFLCQVWREVEKAGANDSLNQMIAFADSTIDRCRRQGLPPGERKALNPMAAPHEETSLEKIMRHRAAKEKMA